MSTTYPEFNIKDDLEEALKISRYESDFLFDQLDSQDEHDDVGGLIAEAVFDTQRSSERLVPGYVDEEGDRFVPTGPPESHEERRRRLEAAKVVDRLERRLILFPTLSEVGLISILNSTSSQLMKTLESSLQYIEPQKSLFQTVLDPNQISELDAVRNSLPKYREDFGRSLGAVISIWDIVRLNSSGQPRSMRDWKAMREEVHTISEEQIQQRVRQFLEAHSYPQSRGWYFSNFSPSRTNESLRVIVDTDHNHFMNTLVQLKQQVAPQIKLDTKSDLTLPLLTKNWAEFLNNVVKLVWTDWLCEHRVSREPQLLDRETRLLHRLLDLGSRPDQFLDWPVSEQSSFVALIEEKPAQSLSATQASGEESPASANMKQSEPPEWLKICEKHRYVTWNAEHRAYVWMETLVKLISLKKRYFPDNNYNYFIQIIPYFQKNGTIRRITVRSLRSSGATAVEPSKDLIRELDQLFDLSDK